MGTLTDRILQAARDLVGVICPDVCSVCDTPLVTGEKVVCLKCLAEMPLTGIRGEADSVLHERVLSTTFRVEKAASMMWYFRESPYAAIIHDAKYRNRPSVARIMTAQYCRELIPEGFFDGIDLIIPVPMHFTKILMRGYNQAEVIAREISRMTGIPTADNLVCTRRHSTQTRKNVAQRYQNAVSAYAVEDGAELEGRHILLVDDVLTTGATLRACFSLIHDAAPTARLSFLTLAATHLR